MRQWANSGRVGRAVVLTALVGCGPEPQAATPKDGPAAPPGLRLTGVLALRPQTRTILRPYRDGVLVGQPGGEARGRPGPLTLVAGDGTRPVPFDAAAVARAADAAENDVMLRDVWAAADGRVLVLVNGYAGRRPLLGLWMHRPGGGGLVKVADAETLGRVTGLGESAQLADGRLVGDGRAAWLLLSVFGQTGVVRLGLEGGPGATPGLRLAAGKLVATDGRAVNIDDATLWPAGDDRALLVRPGAAEHWSIDLPRGLATATPGGLPPLDAADDAGGVRRWAFTPASGRPATEIDAWAAAAERLPAVTLTPATGPAVVIDRDAMRARLGFPAYALRLAAWCAEPRGGRVVAYDAMSGEVFRLTPE